MLLLDKVFFFMKGIRMPSFKLVHKVKDISHVRELHGCTSRFLHSNSLITEPYNIVEEYENGHT